MPDPVRDDRDGRFAYQRRLGEGSFGVVWQVFDHERQATVALKTLTRTDPHAILRFKREFRELTGLVHPNLVTLYELWQHDALWSFTMEYVDGLDFLRAARRGAAPDRGGATRDPALGDADTRVTLDRLASAAAAHPGPSRHAAPTRDHARVRQLLRELAIAVDALHAAGKIHCDLKPSNVLITDRDQLKLLDFGLVTSIDELRRDHAIAGTPGYMAPEQLAGAALTPATDWYAVGVMLHVALTGRRPLDDTLDRALDAPQHWEPEAPSALVDDIPVDLDRLCVRLLRRDPRARPDGAEVLACLRPPDAPAAPARARPTHVRHLVGRGEHLAALHRLRARVAHGPAAALISGASGLGKTTLVRHFLTDLAIADPTALILTGRCFERETVPYQGLDDLVDDLAEQLGAQDPDTVAGLLPDGFDALGHLFPVLRALEPEPATLAPPRRGDAGGARSARPPPARLSRAAGPDRGDRGDPPGGAVPR